MPLKFLRICLTTNDIANIENISPRSATQRMQDIRVFFRKPEKRKKITFKEYSEYSGIPLEELEQYRSSNI